VEIVVGESVYFIFGVGTAFHTSFLAVHPCLPATIFGQKFSSARNQMLVLFKGKVPA